MKKEMENKNERQAIIKKKKKVADLSSKIKSSKVIGLVNLNNVPDRLLQKARKALRGKVEFIAAKNSVIKRALETSKNGEKLIPFLKNPSLLFLSSSLSPYAIAQYFRNNKEKIAAKPGQIAVEDIKVLEGETNLPPGPALSELKSANINAQIRGGKIVIAKESIVVKKGEKISPTVSKALQKLGILPFEAAIRIEAAVDEEGVLFDYNTLDVDSSTLQSDTIRAFVESSNFSINIGYPTHNNINILLINTILQARNLSLNCGVYSTATIQLLLQKAFREANVFEQAQVK
ncbi:MAG: 50S ribosomal protein L10 [Candidatus Anstonellales archaeon]